ncbi:hypothetical protein GGR57DRAFT_458659 [Xylariaceae sp. FL1272]|nr:hypothetical protein GGR57DRAFT_458659 [Xylariaceae sp. FL1272]
MCHANTAVYTVAWRDDPRQPVDMDLKSDSKHICLKWQSLNSWARERALVPGHFKYLSGPYASNLVPDG